jgi:hypothetical protein
MRAGVLRGWWRTSAGLVAIVGMVFPLMTLAVGVIAFEATHEALEKQLDHRIATEIAALINEGDGGPKGVAAAIRRREAAQSTASLDFALVDPDGRRLAGRLDADVPTQPGYVEQLPYRTNGEPRIAQSLTTLFAGGHRLLVAADRAPIDAMDRALLRLIVGAFGLILVLGTAAAWTVGKLTRQRLASIDLTAQAIIGGDLAQRVPVSGTGDEFDHVAETLNRLLDRIAALKDNLRQVSSDVAHDLRTPLTRLHNRLDEAMASDDRDTQRGAIAAATTQSRELLDISAALLRIAEVEGIGSQAQFQPLDLSAIIDGIVETYRPDMEASGHRLTAAIAAKLTVHGDRRLLQQLLTNLLDNALTHTPPGTAVHVALARAGDRIELVVADDGRGVPDGEKARLFQRFTRGERSRTTAGHGLGLALVAAIAAAHGGSIRLTTPPGFHLAIAL